MQLPQPVVVVVIILIMIMACRECIHPRVKSTFCFLNECEGTCVLVVVMMFCVGCPVVEPCLVICLTHTPTRVIVIVFLLVFLAYV